MEPWREELYLQHGWFDNLRSKFKSVSNAVKSTVNNAVSSGYKAVSSTASSSYKKASSAVNTGYKKVTSAANTGYKKVSNSVGNRFSNSGSSSGSKNREWKEHKYVRKEESNGRTRYIYPEDLKKKVKNTGSNIRQKVKKAGNSAGQKAKSINKSVGDSVKKKVNKIVDNLRDTPINMLIPIPNSLLKAAGSVLKDIASYAVDAFTPGQYSREDILNRPASNKISKKDEAKLKKAREKALEKVTKESLTDTKTPSSFDELKRKDEKEVSKKEDQQNVNPLFKTKNWWDIPDYEMPYHINCAYCTLAYEFRRRGYDVEAQPNLTDGPTINDIATWYENPEIKHVRSDNSSQYTDPETGSVINFQETFTKQESADIEKDLLKEGDGSRGQFCVYWMQGGGHSVVWEVDNNKVVLRDCQTGKTYYNTYDILQDAYDVKYFRTDNLKLTDNALNEVCNAETANKVSKEMAKACKELGVNVYVESSRIIGESSKKVTVEVTLSDNTVQVLNYKKKVKKDGTVSYIEDKSKIVTIEHAHTIHDD